MVETNLNETGGESNLPPISIPVFPQETLENLIRIHKKFIIMDHEDAVNKEKLTGIVRILEMNAFMSEALCRRHEDFIKNLLHTYR